MTAPSPRPTIRRRKAVEGLIELYTVVMGVALSLAVVTVVQPAGGLTGVTLGALCLAAAFLVTIVPFHHGAIRHLWDAYLDNQNDHIRTGAVIPDFALLFTHALVFVVLAILLRLPSQFAWALLALLLVDAAWGLFAHFAASTRKGTNPEGRWALLNLLSVAAGAMYLIQNGVTLADSTEPLKLSILIAIFALVRSIIDYVWCAKFYFPDE